MSAILSSTPSVRVVAMFSDGLERCLEISSIHDLGLDRIEKYRPGTKVRGRGFQDVIAIAEECGGHKFGYATIICRTCGDRFPPFTILEREKGWVTKFRFKEGEEFILVRADSAGALLIQRNKFVRGRYRDEWELHISNLAANATLAMIASDCAPEIVSTYSLAVKACLAKLNCRDCHHCHYANIPGTGKRSQKRLEAS